jgi:hypothetical protein
MAQVVDLRGRKLGSARPPVLLDPSGGRARALAWGGRVVAFVFLLWLIGLVFAGLGLLPSGAIPLGRALVGPAPPVLKTLPRLTQPNLLGTGAAGRPGASAASRAAGSSTAATGTAGGVSTGHGAGGARSGASGHGHGSANGNGTAGNSSSSASSGSPAATGNGSGSASHPNNGQHAAGTRPGQTRSQAAPGHTKSSTSGSTSNNGHQSTTTTTTTTTPGKSGSSPGHTASFIGRGNST